LKDKTTLFLFLLSLTRVIIILKQKFQLFMISSQPQVIKFTSCLPIVGGSLQVLHLLPTLKLVAMI